MGWVVDTDWEESEGALCGVGNALYHDAGDG